MQAKKSIITLFLVSMALANDTKQVKYSDLQCQVNGGSFVDSYCFTYSGRAIWTDGLIIVGTDQCLGGCAVDGVCATEEQQEACENAAPEVKEEKSNTIWLLVGAIMLLCLCGICMIKNSRTHDGQTRMCGCFNYGKSFQQIYLEAMEKEQLRKAE